MLRRISVHLDRGFDCARRIEIALELARRHQAEVLGIYASAAPPQYYYGESVLMTNALKVMHDLQAQDSNKVQNAFLERARASDIPASVTIGHGLPSESLSRLARCTDLLIISQENDNDIEAAQEIELVEQTMLSTGRPVMVVPNAGAFPIVGDRVLLSWDGSRESARALSDALPLLRRASSVVVLTMDEGDTRGKNAASTLDELLAYFSAHGLPAPETANRDIKGVGVGETILNAAADFSSDLIVMGAYGHSKLRQWAMGGATSSILRSMTVPILFSH